jgi:hypothetical protein
VADITLTLPETEEEWIFVEDGGEDLFTQLEGRGTFFEFLNFIQILSQFISEATLQVTTLG